MRRRSGGVAHPIGVENGDRLLLEIAVPQLSRAHLPCSNIK
jgi:hypothetical protein